MRTWYVGRCLTRVVIMVAAVLLVADRAVLSATGCSSCKFREIIAIGALIRNPIIARHWGELDFSCTCSHSSQRYEGGHTRIDETVFIKVVRRQTGEILLSMYSRKPAPPDVYLFSSRTAVVGPIHRALEFMYYETLARLVKPLTKSDLKEFGEQEDWVPRLLSGKPLSLNDLFLTAASHGKVSVVKALFEIGIEVNATDYQGETALIKAARICSPEVVRLLLDSGADVNATDREGETALIKAAMFLNPEVVRLLLDSGADPTKKSLNETALDKAKSRGKYAKTSDYRKFVTTVRLLEANNSSPEVGALMIACKGGRLDEVKTLLERGANPACTDREYAATPLHWASYNGHEKVVALLLEKGAPINARNKDGRTPLMMAAAFGHEEVVRLLMEKGADTMVKGKDGYTARDYASLKGHKAVAGLLQAKGLGATHKKARVKKK